MSRTAHASIFQGRAALLCTVMVFALGGCTDPEPGAPEQDLGSPAADAEPAGDPGTEPEDAEPEAPDAVVRVPDSSVPPGLTRLTLLDGSEVTGELVAVYDHSMWWHSEDRKTYALFDGSGFGEWPEDRCIRFVASPDVASVEHGPAAGDAPSPYLQFTREKGLLFDAVPLKGVSRVLLAGEGYHLEEDGYGDFAWDLVFADAQGRRHTGEGTANEEYLVWDAPVYLPTPGVVVEVLRGEPDNEPGTFPEDAEENLVGIGIGGHFYHYFLHFRQGTIPSKEDGTCEPMHPGVACVEVGALLPAGTYLGRVGSSGTSLEPHLHMAMLWYDYHGTPQRTWSVPAELAGVYHSGSRDTPATKADYLVPATGELLSSEGF